MMFRRMVFAFAALALCSLPASAQEKAKVTLHGSVVYKDKAPASGVTVKLRFKVGGNFTGKEYSATTDSGGLFSIVVETDKSKKLDAYYYLNIGDEEKVGTISIDPGKDKEAWIVGSNMSVATAESKMKPVALKSKAPSGGTKPPDSSSSSKPSEQPSAASQPKTETPSTAKAAQGTQSKYFPQGLAPISGWKVIKNGSGDFSIGQVSDGYLLGYQRNNSGSSDGVLGVEMELPAPMCLDGWVTFNFRIHEQSRSDPGNKKDGYKLPIHVVLLDKNDKAVWERGISSTGDSKASDYDVKKSGYASFQPKFEGCASKIRIVGEGWDFVAEMSGLSISYGIPRLLNPKFSTLEPWVFEKDGKGKIEYTLEKEGIHMVRTGSKKKGGSCSIIQEFPKKLKVRNVYLSIKITKHSLKDPGKQVDGFFQYPLHVYLLDENKTVVWDEGIITTGKGKTKATNFQVFNSGGEYTYSGKPEKEAKFLKVAAEGQDFDVWAGNMLIEAGYVGGETVKLDFK